MLRLAKIVKDKKKEVNMTGSSVVIIRNWDPLVPIMLLVQWMTLVDKDAVIVLKDQVVAVFFQKSVLLQERLMKTKNCVMEKGDLDISDLMKKTTTEVKSCQSLASFKVQFCGGWYQLVKGSLVVTWKPTVEPKQEAPKKKSIAPRRFCDIKKTIEYIKALCLINDIDLPELAAAVKSALDGVAPICFLNTGKSSLLRSIFAGLREKEIAYSTAGIRRLSSMKDARFVVLEDFRPEQMKKEEMNQLLQSKKGVFMTSRTPIGGVKSFHLRKKDKTLACMVNPNPAAWANLLSETSTPVKDEGNPMSPCYQNGRLCFPVKRSLDFQAPTPAKRSFLEEDLALSSDED